MTKYLEQGSDTCCFVVAVINALHYCKLPVPSLEECIKIAKCEHGSTIAHQAVVAFAKAPLKPVDLPYDVLNEGGIINILHPIWNGHSLFVYPTTPGCLAAVNSWIGPHVAEMTVGDLANLIPEKHNLGKYWLLNEQW